jgi:curved DNA-binding protein CbpA
VCGADTAGYDALNSVAGCDPALEEAAIEEFGGPALLTDQALEVLALRRGATPSEIKEAYRDLVKVWHPDRFGNDLRLREKSELQLKLINEAYRTLQSHPGVGGMHATGPESASSSSPNDMSGGAYGRRYSGSPNPRNSPGRSSGNGARAGWIYRGLGPLVIFLAVIFLAAYFVTEHDLMQGAGSSRDSGGQQSAGIPVQQTLEASAGGRVVHSTDLNGAGVRPRGAGRSKDPRLRQFRVRSLSAAETDRLETLCSRQKELWGQVVYQSCLKAQLDVITNPAGKPDLSVLGEAERESIESVCSEARRLRGPDSYNRCETEQVASLAAEPARPDLSTLNDVDRGSIESACTNVKNREGPAAYHRCLDRLMRTLEQAK